MKPQFTIQQFFEVFEKYNASVFPAQFIILLLGIFTLYLLHSKGPKNNKIIGFILASFWFWMGIVYHITFFTSINKVAYFFGGIFIIQGAIILLNAINNNFRFSFQSSFKGYLAYFFILFGVIVYPAIGYAMEGNFTETISLGLPCPTTIFTFGLFMLSKEKFPRYLLIIPSVWSLIGLSAAINFGIYQDFMMVIAAIVANIYLFKKK